MEFTSFCILLMAGLSTLVAGLGYRTDKLTGIAVVKDSSMATPIALLAQTFTDLITNGNIFVDKSLIIKHIVEREIGRMKMIARPPGFGKTMILDMIRKFFAVEFDANGEHVLPDEQTRGYKLFELGEYKADGGLLRKLEHPLLISKHKDIMKNHRGHYPVMYSSFSGFKPKDFEEFETGVGLKMRDAFQKYNFEQMLNALREIGRAPDEQTIQRLRNVIELKVKFEWKDLRTMCDMLHRYFNRKPLILIDDYDDPLVEALADHNIVNRRLLVKAITKSYVYMFLELKEGDFYTHAMLTCVTKVMYENYTQEGDVCGVQDPTYTVYHGFQPSDIKSIFHHLGIPDDVRNKSDFYYGGYQMGKFDQNLSNPSSVAKFLASRKFQPYWRLSGALESVFDKCVQNHFFRHLLHQPISAKQKYRIPMVNHDGDFEAVKFARFLDDPEQPFPYGWSDVCLGYAAGFFSNGVEYDEVIKQPYFYEEAIPNEEVRLEMQRKLRAYYADVLGVKKDYKDIQALAHKFETFLYDKLANQSYDMCLYLEDYLHKLPSLNPQLNSPFHIDHIERRTFHSKLAHSLLNFIILFLPGFELHDSNYCDTQEDARAFICMSRGTFGVVIRMTFGYDSADYAFGLTDKLPSRLAPFSYPHLQLTRRVGINYAPTTKVDIIALTTNITGEYDRIVNEETKSEVPGVMELWTTAPDSRQTEDLYNLVSPRTTLQDGVTDKDGMIWNQTQRYWLGNTFDFSKEMDECYHSNESLSV